MTIEDSRLQKLLIHVEHVRIDCQIVGEFLCDNGEVAEGLSLIINGRMHDASKFNGIEWEHLNSGDPLFNQALAHHHANNPHHPEFYPNIHEMPPLYIWEMTCDWKARSNEFCTDLRKWIEKEAKKKYDFNCRDEVSRQIYRVLEILLEPTFVYKKSG
jgi:hypothetical protein